MRNRHGRRTNRCLTVNLGLMAFDDLRIIANQPLPAYRETAKALTFRYARFLQQGQSTAARAYKYKFCVQLALIAAYLVFHSYLPAAIFSAFDVGNVMA